MGYTLDDARGAKRELVKKYMGAVPNPRFVAHHAISDPWARVVGVGVRNGADGLSVRIFVELAAASGKSRLPGSIDGVPVEVVESGRFIAFGTDRLRPAQPGCSIGFRDADGVGMTGTFGALVAKRDDIFILSNNHVLAGENRLAPGAEIVQPGCLDDEDAEPIASLSEFVRLETNSGNALDCAIAVVLNRRSVSPVFLAPINELAGPEPGEPAADMFVQKVSRSTDFTEGQIFGTETDVNVEYPRLGVVRLENQVLIRGLKAQFSERGDSGAVIVDRSSLRGVALLCGGSADKTGLEHVTVANPLTEVLDRLGVRLVTRW